MDEAKKTGASTISVLDLVAVLVRHRWLIALTTFIAAIFIVAYSFYSLKAPPGAPLNYMPNVYRPTVEVRLQDSSGQSLSSFLSNTDIGLLANLAGSDVGSSSSADLAQELLIGNTLLDELTEEYHLVEILEVTDAPKFTTRAFLKNAFTTSFTANTGILTIGFEHTDKEFATEILNSALTKLEDRFKELTLSSVNMRKEILEQSIADYGDELHETQQTLIDFQKEYGIISIEVQTEYKLAAIAAVDSQILTKQSELRTLEDTRRPDDPEVRRTRLELETLHEQREILLTGSANGSTPVNIPQDQLPELSAKFFNLTRDLQIVQAIYSGLRSQFESLKIEEKDTSSQFQIIEQAEVPELKYRPSRSKICVIITITAFFLSIFFSFILEYFDRVKQDPVESQKLREIVGMFGRKSPDKTI
jgi:capsule polysaccharide export protein KpsE/RkpR